MSRPSAAILVSGRSDRARLCGSRKYPYPPTEGIGFSRGEGGVNLPNFPVGRGDQHREIFPEGSRDA